jgi:hypothetical protein
LPKKKEQVYRLGQIEPGSLKNLTAQWKEGATAERRLRPQSFSFTKGFLPAALSLCRRRRDTH